MLDLSFVLIFLLYSVGFKNSVSLFNSIIVEMSLLLPLKCPWIAVKWQMNRKTINNF